MSMQPVCVVYTQDADLSRRMSGLLNSVASVRVVEDASRLETTLHQFGPAVVLLDLHGDDWRDLTPRVRTSSPESVVIALGAARSDVAREAETMGVYGVEDPGMDRHNLLTVVGRAQAHLSVLQENRLLRQEATRVTPVASAEMTAFRGPPPAVPSSFQHFSQAFRSFQDLDAMLNSMVQGVASTVKVSRVGVFLKPRGTDNYRLRAGLRCLETVRHVEIGETDPLVQWLRMRAHLIARAGLGLVDSPVERSLLQKALDMFGAEVIAPLHGRDEVIGWLFVGRQVTGQSFSHEELETLMLLAEHVSHSLENALLYEEAAIQRTLGETLLRSIPVGIVACDGEGAVRWFNPSAEEMLGIPADETMGRPVHKCLIGPLGPYLIASLRGQSSGDPLEWITPKTQRYLSIRARRLETQGRCLGAVLFLNDLTRENKLRDKQQQLERATFWTELSAAMSHEVRNPLVAISTCAQLLPEKYGDPEFREMFSKLVSHEIVRLNGMIEQIDSYANPPALQFDLVDMNQIMEKSILSARQRKPDSTVNIQLRVDEDLPRVRGDEAALIDCFSHLICNSMEAVARKESPTVTVKAGWRVNGVGRECIVEVADNGGGIPADIKDKVFSPFCTTKARGIGLGLPLVKRTVTDHNGQVFLQSDEKGTHVKVVFPSSRKKPEPDAAT
jgi:two-component system nitrogen regulation sensor histidine kinase GlnL